MSEHRRDHRYPYYTATSIGEDDYFTIIYPDMICGFKDERKSFDFPLKDVCGAVYAENIIIYALKEDNKIYETNREVFQPFVIDTLDFCKSIRVWKYFPSKSWLVLECSNISWDLMDSSCSLPDDLFIVYDLLNKTVLYNFPMKYLSDCAILEEKTESLTVLLLGDGCDGEEMFETGDGAFEEIVKLVAINKMNKSFSTIDYLDIVTIYDGFDEKIGSSDHHKENMHFPLFDKYFYSWPETRSISSEGNHIVYYEKDIDGIVIATHRNGDVFRLFRLPDYYVELIEGISLPEYEKDYIRTEDLFFYYNEISNVFSVLYKNRIDQFWVTLRNIKQIEALNDRYRTREGLREAKTHGHTTIVTNTLRVDSVFHNLLYSVLFSTKLEKLSEMKYSYDVALSFAGEDREIVERVLRALKNRQVRVFYDNDYRSELWGSDLTTKEDTIYRTDTKFCMVFCSKDYVAKKWPQYEAKCMRAGQFEKGRNDYILPIKIDDTEIPGIHTTQWYVDLRKNSPEEIADWFIEKLEKFDGEN